jgi:hypothetical protein
MSQRIKPVTVPVKDAELARKFFRRCRELFGDGCVATVRKQDQTDAARQVPCGTTSEIRRLTH